MTDDQPRAARRSPLATVTGTAGQMLAQGLLPCRVEAGELFAACDRAVGGA
jgi:hypothetical protein